MDLGTHYGLRNKQTKIQFENIPFEIFGPKVIEM